MERNDFSYNSKIKGNEPSNEDLKSNNYNEKIENKLRLRKKAYNKILMKKNAIFVEEISNEKMEEIEKLDYLQQYKIMKSHLISNNEANIIKILSYIIEKFCSLPSENKIKVKMIEKGIIDSILDLFYTTNNSNIFSLSSSILSVFCTDYILFSIKMINEDGIKKIYNELQNIYFNNPYIISNCITCYKEGLQHLLDQLISKNETNEIVKDISFNAKRLLCNMVNWVLYNKEIFCSLPQEGNQSFFKLIELLIISKSVPNQYEMKFDLNYSSNNSTHNVHFENIILYPFSKPLKFFEYETLENYLLLLIEITKNENYLPYLIQPYNNKTIFDMIKYFCGYIYLNNNSTDEDRENNPVLDPFFIDYCLSLLRNLMKEAINHDDMMNLLLIFFKNYRSSVKYSEIVPESIMKCILKLSENLNNNQKVYDFIFSQNIINDCIKFYVRNNECYALVLGFLVNVFEVKNFSDIENINLNNVIKCFTDALESKDKEVVNQSIISLGKLIEINHVKKYKIDLILKYEENQVPEKLNSLILNGENAYSKRNAETLLNIIENKIKEEE